MCEEHGECCIYRKRAGTNPGKISSTQHSGPARCTPPHTVDWVTVEVYTPSHCGLGDCRGGMR